MWRRDFPALGAGEQTGERYAGQAGKSVSVSLLSLQAYLSALPRGVSHAQQSERLMKLCVIMWSLGLSHRSVVLILSVFGVKLSHMSGWRDEQEAGRQIQPRLKWKPARIVGVDGAWVNGKGIMVAVDLGDGELLALAEIDEKEKVAVETWLKTLKQQHNIGAIVTDDLATYKEIAQELEVGHQICQFHVRRWGGTGVEKIGRRASAGMATGSLNHPTSGRGSACEWE